MAEQFTKSITVGPIGIFFTNQNTTMKLRGHSHYAEVKLEFETLGKFGFPSFEPTVNALHNRLVELTEKAFRDSTNEDVADAIFETFDGWSHPALDEWGGDYVLRAIELGVMGVRDKISHAPGLTWYRVERTHREEPPGA